MPRNRVVVGACPTCGKHELLCSYNHFQNGPETIDSWEHRCRSCSFRETNAFRKGGDKPSGPEGDPRKCPMCGRSPEEGR